MLTPPPWLLAAACGITLAAGFAAGWTVQGWRWEAKEAERLEAEAKAKDEAQAKADESATGFEQDRAQITETRDRDETTIRTIYKDRIVPADCALDAGARGVLAKAVDAANAARLTGQPVPVAP